jgi:hypothetical protein
MFFFFFSCTLLSPFLLLCIVLMILHVTLFVIQFTPVSRHLSLRFRYFSQHLAPNTRKGKKPSFTVSKIAYLFVYVCRQWMAAGTSHIYSNINFSVKPIFICRCNYSVFEHYNIFRRIEYVFFTLRFAVHSEDKWTCPSFSLHLILKQLRWLECNKFIYFSVWYSCLCEYGKCLSI